MATQHDKDRDEAMARAEEIGAKTDGEARAKLKSDEANAPALAGPVRSGKARESVFDHARRSLGFDTNDMKVYEHRGDTVTVEKYSGGPPLKTTVSQMYTPLIERALQRFGIGKDEIKAAPGVSPNAIEVPVKGVKVGDPRFEGAVGITIPMDGMISIDRQALLDEDDPSTAKPVRKSVQPVSQDLSAAAIAKAKVDQKLVKSVQRSGEDMIVTMNDGSAHRVRIATL